MGRYVVTANTHHSTRNFRMVAIVVAGVVAAVVAGVVVAITQMDGTSPTMGIRRRSRSTT